MMEMNELREGKYISTNKRVWRYIYYCFIHENTPHHWYIYHSRRRQVTMLLALLSSGEGQSCPPFALAKLNADGDLRLLMALHLGHAHSTHLYVLWLVLGSSVRPPTQEDIHILASTILNLYSGIAANHWDTKGLCICVNDLQTDLQRIQACKFVICRDNHGVETQTHSDMWSNHAAPNTIHWNPT